MKKKWPTLYARTTTGQTQVWTIQVDGNKFWTVEGIKDGKLTTSVPTTCEGKNIGRANETTPEDQAAKEAQAKWQKKIDAGYFENIKHIDNETFFEPMLAHKYKDYPEHVTPGWIGQAKLDGARLIARSNGLWSRKGKPYVSVPHIQKALAPLFKAHPTWIVDGEAYCHDIPFERIMHCVRPTKPSKDDLIESAKLIKYYIYDCMLDDKTLGYRERWEQFLQELKNIKGLDMSVIILADCLVINDKSDIQKVHDKFVQDGYEGLILRNPIAEYQNKRTKDLLKHKVFFDEEYEIIDITEGKGSRSSMMGRIRCRDKKGNEFEANAKGTQAYYTELWENKDKYIGQMATVRYQELTDKGVPRFGVVHSIRDYE